MTYREAVRAALREEMQRDGKVFLMGEEIGQFQGAYKVTQGLLDEFGAKRVIDTPISEAGFSGLGIGASMLGLRPVVEFMFFSFLYVAYDQAINNAANIRYMSGGLINCPITFRGPANGGTNVGATHSHTPENIVANSPGLKVCVPSTPHDVKGLMKAAIRDDDPTYVMESTILYNLKGDVPDEEYVIPFGVADVKKEGSDLSLITYGRPVHMCLEAADKLKERHGLNVEVVDLRSIRPLDEDAIYASVRKTHRAVFVEEQRPFCGTGAQVSHMIQEHCFDDLDAPVKRVSCVDAPAIYAKPLEQKQLPNVDRIVAVAESIL